VLIGFQHKLAYFVIILTVIVGTIIWSFTRVREGKKDMFWGIFRVGSLIFCLGFILLSYAYDRLIFERYNKNDGFGMFGSFCF
jgi:hypothetical protein